MARLPTVTIRRKSDGKIKVVNQSDYAQNLNIAREWSIVSESRGDGNVEAEKFHVEQTQIETDRKNDPAREKKFGDKERAQKARSQTTTNITTESPGGSETPTGETAPEVPVASVEPKGEGDDFVEGSSPSLPENWRKIKWPELRKIFYRVYGRHPKNKKDAEAMASGETD